MDSFRTNKTSCIQFHEIVGLIDQGASLFWAKKYGEACSSLSRALEVNKEMLVSQHGLYDQSQRKSNERRPLCVETPSAASSSSTPPCQRELMDFVIARSIIKSGLLLHDDDGRNEEGMCSWWIDKHYNMCANPTLLVVQPCGQLFELFASTSTQETQLTFSLIIIFNLALSHHFHALDQIKNGCSFSIRCNLLNRAYLLYKHAEVLLHQLELQSCWLLSLVISNNEAQLLLMMGEHQQASALLHSILSCLCYLNVCSRTGMEDLAPVAFLEAFIYNTAYIILNDVTTAAAA